MRTSTYPRYAVIDNIIGQIPIGWRTERLFDVSELRTSNVDKKSVEGQPSVKLCNYVDVYYHSKITADIKFMESTASINEIKRFSLRYGDVVFTKDSEDPFDIGIPTFIAQDIDELVCGYHLTLVRPDTECLLGEFAYYALESELSKFQFTLAANGVTRFGLTYNGTKNIKICLPPLQEQQQIAKYLDYKTTQIDRLIAKKKALIEKLDEKRIAIITQAVTKGLDPTVPMRDSGVEWLGEVPEHWGVMKMSHIVRLKSGESITSMQISPSGTFPVYGGNGQRGYFESYTHEGEYVLIGRQGALCGNINYASGKFWASEHAVVVTPDRPLSTVWLGELLRVMDLGQYSVSAAQPGISVEQIARLKMPYPPIAEQEIIAEYISGEINKIQEMIAVTQKTIDRLTEYRTAMITAAVTGKIDVRNFEVLQET